MAQSRIVELAQAISENTSIIESAMLAHELALPSFEPGVSVEFPAEIARARDIVLDATQELNDLLFAPLNLMQRKGSVRLARPVTTWSRVLIVSTA
jgi:hypothetical protein